MSVILTSTNPYEIEIEEKRKIIVDIQNNIDIYEKINETLTAAILDILDDDEFNNETLFIAILDILDDFRSEYQKKNTTTQPVVQESSQVKSTPITNQNLKESDTKN